MFFPRAFRIPLALVATCLIANAQSWQSLNGPTRPHEVVDIAIGKDANVQRIYAVDVDTMKLSTDGGRTWIATGGASLSNPMAVACQAANPSIAVVGRPGKDYGIYRTSDAGTNWIGVGPSPDYDLQPQRVAISSKGPSLAFLGTERTPGDDQTTL